MKPVEKYTASLISNKEPEQTDIQFSDVIKYLKKNSISVIELYEKKENGICSAFYNSKEIETALNEEKELYARWQADFLEIKARWDAEGIDYIFHKSFGDFPYLSGNLDILVKEKDFVRAHEILIELNYVDLRNIQEAHKKFYKKNQNGREYVPIHLHERICWSVPFEDNKHVWENYKVSEINPVIHFLCKEDAILLILAHHFLEDHALSLFDLLMIKKCIHAGEIDWVYTEKTAYALYWGDTPQ